ncbi:MAG: SpoIID/LytB domain-containing protein [Bacteroidaceae bacterium]|nr:SpoIID/LytB domain-containing protein [Bacteroidaceae bacterium]
MEEPVIKVGIITAQCVRFCLNAAYDCNGKTLQPGDVEVAEATPTGICWRGKLFHELAFVPKEAADASFSLFDVTIGLHFHWERKETQTFRGSLRLVPAGGGMLCAINVLPLEEYLACVVSSEMSATASLEFLKAHAVISRSWLLAQIRSTHKQTSPQSVFRTTGQLLKWYDHDDHLLFDVCADDHCQRYQGTGRMNNANAPEAVSQTRGRVLMYGGEICDARFSKCCGGRLELFSSCWDDEDKPYLVSKPDIINDVRAREVKEAFCNTDDTAVLSQVLNNYDQETHDFYRWTVAYTTAELSRLVAKKSGLDFGTVLDLRPLKRGPSGRIVLLEIVGTRMSLTVGKELEIRKWLSPTHLYSSAFSVERTEDGFVLHGKGWGHGVGLCQIGAAVMGTLGYSYDEILQHYYPGSELTDYYT